MVQGKMNVNEWIYDRIQGKILPCPLYINFDLKIYETPLRSKGNRVKIPEPERGFCTLSGVACAVTKLKSETSTGALGRA